GKGAREVMVNPAIGFAEEIEGLQVFPSAMAVGNPISRFTGIIEVEHRSDGINADSINVISLKPGKYATEEEAGHLVATVIKDQRPPILVKTLAGVGMFIEGRPVKLGQGKSIFGEVSRHPVDQ